MAVAEGFSLHAGTSVHENDTEALARPSSAGTALEGPSPESRLSRRDNGSTSMKRGRAPPQTSAPRARWHAGRARGLPDQSFEKLNVTFGGRKSVGRTLRRHSSCPVRGSTSKINIQHEPPRSSDLLQEVELGHDLTAFEPGNRRLVV